MILRSIREHFPADEILAEEVDGRGTGPGRGSTARRRRTTHGFPVFCVSIDRTRGTIVGGVIYDLNLASSSPPSSGWGLPERIADEGLRHRPDDLQPLVTGFRITSTKTRIQSVERFIGALMNAQAVRRMGSAADMAYGLRPV